MDHNGEVVTESCHRRGGEGGGILLTRCLRQGLGGVQTEKFLLVRVFCRNGTDRGKLFGLYLFLPGKYGAGAQDNPLLRDTLL